MISIEGAFVLNFRFGELENFIQIQNLKTFSLIEDAGGILPTFKLIFETSEEKIMKSLNQGARLQVDMGSDNLNMNTIDLVCISVLINKMGGDSFLINISGIYDALDYIVEPRLNISSSSEDALTALTAVAGTYFNVDFDPNSSEDSQIYIQANISDKKFAQFLVSHAKLSNSAPIFGITSEGKFKVRDIKKLASEPYTWKFAKEIEDSEKDIIYESGDVLEGSSGMINSICGYGRKIYELNYDTGVSVINTETSTSVFSNASAPSRKASIGDRMGNIVPMNDNLDPNFYKTELRNSMYNLTCSQYKKTVRFVNVYKPVEILDLAMYSELAVSANETLEYTSGLYVITKVVRNISGGFFQTICELCRESLNNPEGDIR